MKVSLILVAILLLSMPLILAVGWYNVDDKLTIKVYNATPYNLITEEFTLKIEFISNKDPGWNNREFTMTTNFSKEIGINWDVGTFDYRVLTNATAENIDFIEELFDCKDEKDECETLKASLNTGFNTCALDRDRCLDEYEGENATTYKGELDTCNLRIQQKDIEINAKAGDITDLEQEKVDTKNSKWFYAIGGVLAGVVGLLLYQGKLGEKAKEKSRGEFNPQQAS